MMHIKSKHKETHENARVKYVKSQHSMFGIPMCKFCMKLQCDWQLLEKHITMGGCTEIKTAIAKGITMEQLLEETDQAHEANPPQPPEAIKRQLQHKVLLSEGAEMYFAQNSELERHTVSTQALSASCALCGQVLLSGARVKPHWRKAHPAAWAQASHDAISECKSLASIFRKPCQFCGSQARNSNIHAGQCSALFQVMAGRRLRLSGLQESAGQHGKAPKQRSSETEAAYTSFDLKQTPLAKAFQKGAGEKPQIAFHKASLGDEPRRSEAKQPARHTTRGSIDAKTGQTSLKHLFGSSRRSVAGEMQSTSLDRMPWTFRLRLGNPHQLCYMNAGILSLLHASQDMRIADLAGIEALCRQRADRGHILMLSRQLVMRSTLPRWDFGPTQRDVSEFLLSFLSTESASWFRWEARQVGPGGIRVVDRGGPALFLEVPAQEPWTPTQAFARWHAAEAVRAISHVGNALIVQVGRYVNGYKDVSRIDLASDVLVPEFSEGVEVRQQAYRVRAVVMHLGVRPTSGHYRALLREGNQWGYSDDGIAARIVGLHAEHQQNAYMLFLVRSSQA